MDCSKVGGLILALRKEKGMTQKALADAMNISDRTISKWECGLGCPDVSLLGELSGILGVDIEKILRGDLEPNDMDSGNIKKIKFYHCPVCGSISFSAGNNEVSCCGRKLRALTPQPEDAQHLITVDEMDGEYYLTAQHEMTKEHYLTFAACVSWDRVMVVKLYPEQEAAAHFPRISGGEWYVCCNQHGLVKRTKNKT